MAGDWIAWQKGLARKPKVLFIARKTGQSRREVAATLAEFWEWADEQSEDGLLPHMSLADLRETIPETTKLFWDLVVKVGWLAIEPNGLRVPHFNDWNGESAKKRLRETQRKKAYRERDPVPLLSQKNWDRNGTTEQDKTGNKSSNTIKESACATGQVAPNAVDAAAISALTKQFNERGLATKTARDLVASVDASLPEKVLTAFDAMRQQIKKPGAALRTMLTDPESWGFAKNEAGEWTSPMDAKIAGLSEKERQAAIAKKMLEDRELAKTEREQASKVSLAEAMKNQPKDPS